MVGSYLSTKFGINLLDGFWKKKRVLRSRRQTPKSLKVKCDAIYGFLLIYMSNCMSISHRLAVIANKNIFSNLLSLGPNYEKLKVHWITLKWH